MRLLRWQRGRPPRCRPRNSTAKVTAFLEIERHDRKYEPVEFFAEIHLAEPESLCNGTMHGQFAVQNPIEDTAIDVMAFRKIALTSFTFNCGSQKANNFAFLKYKRATAQIAGGKSRTFLLKTIHAR